MRVGILGAGQLARMLVLAGYPLGLSFSLYETQENTCAFPLASTWVGGYDNHKQLSAFADTVDVITLETENIPQQVVSFLSQRKPVYPRLTALSVSQDRVKEKIFCQEQGIPVPSFREIGNKEDLLKAGKALKFPLILKTRRMGYDGKGQVRLADAQALEALPLSENEGGWIVEEMIPFEREVSMLAVRSVHGEQAFYDLSENGHDAGILRQTRNSINDPLWGLAKEYVTTLMCKLEYVGTFAVEFFVHEGKLLVNEMAPRVHNSGHWTIDAAVTSQFENHLRAIVGWPLGDTTSLGQAIMTNFIGEMPSIQGLLSHPDMHVHSYGKEARPGRKIGHMTKVIRK